MLVPSRLGCRGGSWPDATMHLQTTFQTGMREWVLAAYQDDRGEIHHRYVLYWVTPKAAHTKITKLLRSPPFTTLNTSAGHDGVDSTWSPEKVQAVQRWAAPRGLGRDVRRIAEAQLEAALRLEPLEFTFIREPLSHLVSAAAQAHFCLSTTDCTVREQAASRSSAPLHLDSAADVVRLLNYSLKEALPPQVIEGDARAMRIYSRFYKRWRPCTSRERAGARLFLHACLQHMRPQSAGGLPFHAGGREPRGGGPRAGVHFIGQMEALGQEWRRLLPAR